MCLDFHKTVVEGGMTGSSIMGSEWCRVVTGGSKADRLDSTPEAPLAPLPACSL